MSNKMSNYNTACFEHGENWKNNTGCTCCLYRAISLSNSNEIPERWGDIMYLHDEYLKTVPVEKQNDVNTWTTVNVKKGRNRK